MQKHIGVSWRFKAISDILEFDSGEIRYNRSSRIIFLVGRKGGVAVSTMQYAQLTKLFWFQSLWLGVCVYCVYGKSSLILSRTSVNNNANNHTANTDPGTDWLKCIILENYVSHKNMLDTIGFPPRFSTKEKSSPLAAVNEVLNHFKDFETKIHVFVI